MKPILFAFISILLVGCVAETQKNGFAYGEPFEIYEGNSFTAESKMMTIKEVKILDSRCSGNTECFWEGELGVKFVVVSPVSSKNVGEDIYLGETTNQSTFLFGHTLTLKNVDPYTQKATIIVTGPKVE